MKNLVTSRGVSRFWAWWCRLFCRCHKQNKPFVLVLVKRRREPIKETK
jgi:hypothetical protein